MRAFLGLTLALLLTQSTLGEGKQIKIRVTETAGIRRFGYPVSVVLPLADPVKDTEHFRLLDGNKPVSAQFRPHGDTSKGIRAVSLDFNASPGPLEKHDYVVEDGPGVSSSEPRSGLRVETAEKEFRIIHPGGLQFVVPRDLAGLLYQVQTKKLKFVNPESTGLMLWKKGDKRLVLNPNALRELAKFAPQKIISKVIKDGPLAVGVRFEGKHALGDTGELPFTIEMEFPISKSWVRVDWSIEDNRGEIASLGAHLNLHVEGEPTLIDFGAGTSVYAHLRHGESARLRQRDPDNPGFSTGWEVLLGPVGALKEFVMDPNPEQPHHVRKEAEGWAHIMDRERCTAVAVAEFAKSGGADIIVDADGSLRLWHHFGSLSGLDFRRGQKQLTFWLHFVDMPVHVGAATSPQAMLAPLKVEIGDMR
jgi:hypothetical protein